MMPAIQPTGADTLFISVPRLGVYYFLSLTLSVHLSIRLSVCLFVMDKLKIDSSFLFLGGIEPFFGRQFSMTPIQNCFLRFLI